MRNAPLLALAAGLGLAGAGAGTMGGWAVITVENPPEALEAGATYQLEYTVRQHGEEPLSDLRGTLRIQPAGGRLIEVAASPAGQPGRYRATFTVPAARTVDLTVASGFGPKGYSELALVPITVTRRGEPRPALAGADRARALFVAKGCGTCHLNGDVPEWAARNRPSGNFAPDLTGRVLDAAYVRQRLTNPRSLPAIGTGPLRMPQLNLAQAEVEALVQFLGSRDQRAGR